MSLETSAASQHFLSRLRRRVEWFPEWECFWTRSNPSHVVELGDRLIYGRNVTSRHPPQYQRRLEQVLKPVAPPPQEIQVLAAVDEVPQLFARLPDAEVDDDVITHRAGGGGVVGPVSRVAPDETWRPFGEGVDGVEPVQEGLELGRIERGDGAAEVEDGQMVASGHGTAIEAPLYFYVNEYWF